LALAVSGFLLWGGGAYSETTFSYGEGSAVASIDLSTTFDQLDFAHNGTALSDFSTSGINVSTNGNSYYGDNAWGVINSSSTYFNPFHLAGDHAYSYAPVGGGYYFAYDGEFGNSDWVTISLSTRAKMYGVEFLYGNGWTTGDIYGTNTGYPWGNSSAFLEWKTYSVGKLVSSGTAGVDSSVMVGEVVGFSDPNGFDQLMVRCTTPGNGNLQELALDNLNVQTSAVPEPSAMVLLALGDCFAGALRFVRKS
jgi:hypothetical protein